MVLQPESLPPPPLFLPRLRPVPLFLRESRSLLPTIPLRERGTNAQQ